MGMQCCSGHHATGAAPHAALAGCAAATLAMLHSQGRLLGALLAVNAPRIKCNLGAAPAASTAAWQVGSRWAGRCAGGNVPGAQPVLRALPRADGGLLPAPQRLVPRKLSIRRKAQATPFCSPCCPCQGFLPDRSLLLPLLHCHH